MTYLTIALVAFTASVVTFYSGFGLGTILMPVFALFFPVEIAVAATAVVHGTNNVFKVSLLGRHADRELVLKFGLPAMVAAVAGALALGTVAQWPPLLSYQIGPKHAEVTPVKLAIALLMTAFALLELMPRLRQLRFDRKYLFVGGLLSGFFGGFSGHQGALRSAFLAKTDVEPRAFVATNAVIGFLVDLTRLATYAWLLMAGHRSHVLSREHWPLLAWAIAGAFLGILVGKRHLHKVTMNTVQILTGILLLLIAAGLALGLI